jgi:hypothetical protein
MVLLGIKIASQPQIELKNEIVNEFSVIQATFAMKVHKREDKETLFPFVETKLTKLMQFRCI